MLGVERWAELRREHFVRGVPINQLARRYGIDRNTVRRAVRSDEPPRYEGPPRPSKLAPFTGLAPRPAAQQGGQISTGATGSILNRP